MYVVTLHGYLDENDVKSTCGGTGLEFKIEKYGKFLIGNLTQCQLFSENLTRREKTYLKIFCVVFCFKSKSDT